MIGQLTRFASIGFIATLLHVVAALAVSSIFSFAPQSANSVGFLSAVTFSYFGHGVFTFGAKLRHEVHGPKFLLTALAGFLISSGLTQVIAVWLEAPFAVAMAVVAVVVPTSTYLLCKIWVFVPSYSRGP